MISTISLESRKPLSSSDTEALSQSEFFLGFLVALCEVPENPCSCTASETHNAGPIEVKYGSHIGTQYVRYVRYTMLKALKRPWMVLYKGPYLLCLEPESSSGFVIPRQDLVGTPLDYIYQVFL